MVSVARSVTARHGHGVRKVPPLVGNPDIPAGSPYPYSSLQVFSLFLLCFLPFLSCVVCGLRLYSKRIVRKLGLDDWIMCMAVVLVILQSILQFMFARATYIGVHFVEIPMHNLSDGLFQNYFAQIIYTPILALTKISALVFLLRLGAAKTRLRYCMHGLIWFLVAQLLTHVFQTIFECTPVEKGWQPWIEGACQDAGVYSSFNGSVNILTDILVLSMPLFVFIDLNINKRARNALIGVYMLGIITTTLSVVRLYFVYSLFYGPREPDGSYNIAYIAPIAETNMAIVTASLPTLWPLARRYFPSLFQHLGINEHHYPDIETQPATKKGLLGRWRGQRRESNPFSGRVTWTRKKPAGGHGVFAMHTIGGTSFATQSISEEQYDDFRKIGDSAVDSSTHLQAITPAHIRDESDDDVLETYHDILRATESRPAYSHDTESMGSLDKPPLSQGTDRPVSIMSNNSWMFLPIQGRRISGANM
ncbi:hypothetical protein GQ53DRAFT_828718 [Thozetella sp. PMI_491]|nr:hypothetical protein GQ53DRAFT_828718 [Thozetella sp. PMI_491]